MNYLKVLFTLEVPTIPPDLCILTGLFESLSFTVRVRKFKSKFHYSPLVYKDINVIL